MRKSLDSATLFKPNQQHHAVVMGSQLSKIQHNNNEMMLYKLKKSRSPRAMDLLKRNNHHLDRLLSKDTDEKVESGQVDLYSPRNIYQSHRSPSPIKEEEEESLTIHATSSSIPKLKLALSD